MIQNDIYFNGSVAGYAEIERKGLYYRFSCMCSLAGNEPYRILVTCGDRQVDLGTCVPYESGFGLRTQIPVKRLGEGKLEFRVQKKNQDAVFVPIVQDQLFPYLDRICQSKLVKQDDQVGICLSAESVPQDSDPNP